MKKSNRVSPAPPDRLTEISGKVLLCSAMVCVFWAMFKAIFRQFDDIAKYAAVDWAVYGIFAAVLLFFCIFPLCTGYARRLWIKAKLKDFFSADRILLLILPLLVITSSLSMTGKYGGNWLADNGNKLLDTLLCVCVCYSVGNYLAVHGMPAAAKWVAFGLMTVLTGVMIWIIIGVCKPTILYTLDGHQIGMTASLRLIINCNPNTTGAISAAVFTLCLIAAIASRGALRIAWSAMVPVHFFILVLSDSRAAYYSIIILLSCMAAILVYDRVKDKRRIPFAILAFVISAALFFFLQQGLRLLYMEIAGFARDGADLLRDPTSLSGRKTVWYHSLRTIVYNARNFFFGTSPAGVVPMLNMVSDGVVEAYTHNELLEVAVALGVPGLCVFVAWLVQLAKRCLRIGFGENPFRLKVIPLAILSLLAANMMEATLIFYEYFMGYVFFIFCGYVMEKVRITDSGR